MQKATPGSARLHVMLASDAPEAVILRRGPSKHVQLWRWRTDVDEFIPGQWLVGRAYEHACDLSPDGKYLVLGVMKKNRGEGELLQYHTVVSKPPYFSALATWQASSFGYGGLFESAESLKVLGDYNPDEAKIVADCPLKIEASNLVADTYLHRLNRSGWTFTRYKQEEPIGLDDLVREMYGFVLTRMHNGHSSTNESRQVVYEATKSVDPWKIVMTEYWQGWSPKRRFTAFHGEDEFRLDRVTWADFDAAGRLVVARSGQIVALQYMDGELGGSVLADLNDSEFEPMSPPDFATQWGD